MKQRLLQITTFLSLFVTGFWFSQLSWGGGDPSAAEVGERPPRAGAADPLSTEAGRRWLQCQPTHWRGYLLQN
jgi:hypothetical protein